MSLKYLSGLILIGLLVIFSYQLRHPHINNTAGLVGEPLPSLPLRDITSGIPWNEQTLKGQVSLINVWATWCYACESEHPFLMKISRDYHIPIYGIAYKDQPQTILQWLTKHGNPFIKIASDQYGSTALDLGIYGTPETFIINKQGYIVYRHIGMIDQLIWENVLYPLILKYQQQP